MAHKIRSVFALLGTMLVTLVMYVLLHESGHALVAISCGADPVKISILSAHTRYMGGSFSVVTGSLCNVAGAALPVCVLWIAMLFYSKDCKRPIYHLAYAFFFISTTSSVFAWVFLPICYMFAPDLAQTDDVVKFLNVSGISPVIVFLTSVIVILLNIFIAVRKQLFHTLVQISKDIGRDGGVETFLSDRSMSVVAVAVSIAVSVTILLELPDMTAKPIVSFTIADEVPETATRMTFDIQHERIYRFQTKIDSEGLLAVASISEQAQGVVFQNIIFDRTDSNSTFLLSPGTYTLSITYLTDMDMCERFCSAMGHDFGYWEQENYTAVYEQEAKLTKLFIELEQEPH